MTCINCGAEFNSRGYISPDPDLMDAFSDLIYEELRDHSLGLAQDWGACSERCFDEYVKGE